MSLSLKIIIINELSSLVCYTHAMYLNDDVIFMNSRTHALAGRKFWHKVVKSAFMLDDGCI